MTMLKCPLAAVAASVPLLAICCATNPATGESQLALVSEQREIQLGRQEAQQVRQTVGLVDDDALQSYVNRVGLSLAMKSERPDLPWSFAVVDDASPNAFALPGGFIFVTRGLTALLTSEAELASVLGHEIGHVTARHAVNQISKQQVAQISLGLGGVLAPDIPSFSPLIGTGLNLLFLKYSRDDERQADELGFQYVQLAQYDVTAFANVFAVLQRNAQVESRGAVPGWLSTHPTTTERIETARAHAAAVGAQPHARVGRDRFLREIDGLVYGPDPRHGYFVGNDFYHPDLRLHVRFPDGWERSNTPQAVGATSPDGQANVELTVTSGTSPDASLRIFEDRHRGVQFGAARREQINGLPAVTAEFVAEAQPGPVRGIATFIEYRTRTFLMLGYGSRSRFGALSTTITHVVHSFEPLTDPRRLSVSPRQIDVMRLDRAQTLGEFAERFPSEIPVPQLAVINQVAGESSVLPAGELVKRVVS